MLTKAAPFACFVTSVWLGTWDMLRLQKREVGCFGHVLCLVVPTYIVSIALCVSYVVSVTLICPGVRVPVAPCGEMPRKARPCVVR